MNRRQEIFNVRIGPIIVHRTSLFCEIEIENTPRHRRNGFSPFFPFFFVFLHRERRNFKDKEIILIFVPVIYHDHPRFLKPCRVTNIKGGIIWRTNGDSTRASSPFRENPPPKNILLRSGSGRNRLCSPLVSLSLKLLKIVKREWK